MMAIRGLLPGLLVLWVSASSWSQLRPMEVRDVVALRTAETPVCSPDGRWAVFALQQLNWGRGERYTDLYLVSLSGGPTRRMTFTEDHSESQPAWHPDSRSFFFVSNREGRPQLYRMALDGGEAQRLTNERDGIGVYRVDPRGRYVAYTGGDRNRRQLYLYELSTGRAEVRTRFSAAVEQLAWSADGRFVYVLVADTLDPVQIRRREQGFDVRRMDEPEPPRHLWRVPVPEGEPERVTEGPWRIVQFRLSQDGRYAAVLAVAADRYVEPPVDTELFLVELSERRMQRLTTNRVSESNPSFSPDGRYLAVQAPRNFALYDEGKLHLFELPSGRWLRALPEDFPYDADLAFWSPDGRRLYFTAGEGVRENLFSVSAEGGPARRETNLEATITGVRDEASGQILIRYSDPQTPPDWYAARLQELGRRDRWVRLSDANPEARNWRLASVEVLRWKSTDGQMVEGLVVKPLDFQPGRRYPLIAQIHGGPASAYTLSFPGSWSNFVHVWAARGYLVFMPNYRGSSHYGERFRRQIAGDYFRQAFDDIMTGIDTLIQRGWADPERLGIMGWSAGGHWSNWALVSTDRFRAISTGAGAVNWISLYAQTDVQFTREFYFQGTPYERWDHYLEVSPLRYIRRARTPTLIHFGEEDERIPLPQGQELYMALKKLGVPVEFFIYPGMGHGITRPKYQFIKMLAELDWFDYWLQNRRPWPDWGAWLQAWEQAAKP
ncbi:MAG: S9 family peptidase [Bacteroidetes bacterium]|nr:S9 family peptidase [Rhodothermia bacterium]MCS7154846.1 S9 family peptidase [Bacteroidota bacterium]MCX7906996.1 S9 family peptidase [Bacteroidota bacterium]MDW8137640.1 S9 family peptidase [Bacteroidota bacterium]MDW8285406.1 S9 family peptidase [Bacteroidota bacterium]